MLKMNKVICVLSTLLVLGACTPEKEAKTKKQLALEELDTLYLDHQNSSLDIERYRVFSNKTESVKLGKMGIHFNVKDLSLLVNASYKIDSGYVVYNKKTFKASVFLSTSQINTLQVDSAKLIKFGTPGYILNKGSKFIRFDFNGNMYPHEREPTTAVFLTAGDSLGAITTHNSKILIAYAAHNQVKQITSTFSLDGIKWNLFEKENKGEIVKDSISGKINLKFKF